MTNKANPSVGAGDMRRDSSQRQLESVSTASTPPLSSRKLRYDILRVLAAFIVIAYHFDCALPDYLNYANYPRPFMDGLGTGLFSGNLAVALFFMLSGFFTYRSVVTANFEGAKWVKRRLVRLLVPMWIAWPIGYAAMLLVGNLGRAPGWTFILTIVGMDGYQGAYFGIHSWGKVGEWYTGAIIFVTLLFPVVCAVMRKWGVKKCFVALLCAQFILGVLLTDVANNVQYWRSVPVSLVSYSAGLLLAELKSEGLYVNRIRLAWIIAVSAFICSLVVRCSTALFMDAMRYQLEAVSYLMFAELACELPVQCPERLRRVAKRLLPDLSKISYQFYLFNHVAIYVVLHYAHIAANGATVYTMPVVVLLALSVGLAIALSLAEIRIEEYLRGLLA